MATKVNHYFLVLGFLALALEMLCWSLGQVIPALAPLALGLIGASLVMALVRFCRRDGRAVLGVTALSLTLLLAGVTLNRMVFGSYLHWAVSMGSRTLTQWGLALGCDSSESDRMRRTPLHWAAYRGHASIVQVLLEAGANPRPTARTGEDALGAAALGGHLDVVQALLPQFDEVTGDHLRQAVLGGNADVVKVFVQHGADVNARDGLGEMPLHWAALRDDHSLVEWLLAQGADPTLRNAVGMTPSEIAASVGDAALAQSLASAQNEMRSPSKEARADQQQ